MIASSTGIGIVDTIVQFHRLIPVVLLWVRVETVIASAFGRRLLISWKTESLGTTGIESVHVKTFARTIIEVVLWIEVLAGIIILAKVMDSSRFANAFVLACHMVWNEVDDDFHTRIMRALNKILKLLHAVRNRLGNIWVDVVIIGNGVWRACYSFHHLRVLTWYSKTGIVSACGMAYNTSIPNMGYAQLPHTAKLGTLNVVHLPDAILLNRSPFLAGGVAIAEEASEDLVYYYLLHLYFVLGS